MFNYAETSFISSIETADDEFERETFMHLPERPSNSNGQSSHKSELILPLQQMFVFYCESPRNR